jgi:hypothetical protein
MVAAGDQPYQAKRPASTTPVVDSVYLADDLHVEERASCICWPGSVEMTVLMTGFPGFLGSALLPGILKRTDGAAMCLVQSKFAALAEQHVAQLSAAEPVLQGRIQVAEGDITQPGWASAQISSTTSPRLGTSPRRTTWRSAVRWHSG